MNIVLFCRILSVDIETLKPKILEPSGLKSEEDKNQNISLQPVQVQNNPVAVGKDQDSQSDCDFDFPLEESLCGKSPDNLINQNISNGCHQRKQWTEHIVVDNNRDWQYFKRISSRFIVLAWYNSLCVVWILKWGKSCFQSVPPVVLENISGNSSQPSDD